MGALAAAAILSTAAIKSAAQTAPVSDPKQKEPSLTVLSPPIYPPLAKVARIAGEVNVTVSVRQDGSVESAVVISGHPILKRAALESAQQSHFDCRNCSDVLTSLTIIYTFQLGPTIYCGAIEPATKNQPEQPYPQITQLQNHITVIDQPVGTCDTAPKIGLKVRSAKCLYLWKCGLRYIARADEPGVPFYWRRRDTVSVGPHKGFAVAAWRTAAKPFQSSRSWSGFSLRYFA